MSDEIDRLLASIPVLRCPEGHAGSFVLIRTNEFLYHLEDNGKFLVHDKRAYDSTLKDQTLMCGICSTRFPVPDDYEIRSKIREGGTEEEAEVTPNIP
jgi:hypothetical protein